MSRLLASAFSLVLVAAAVPSAAEWKSLGPPGDTVNALALDPRDPKVLYAGAREGLFKSTDGGDTWKQVPGLDLTVLAVAVDPKAPVVVYAGAWNAGLHKSTDGGATWKQLRARSGYDVSGQLSVDVVAIDPANTKNLMFSSLFRSSDAGADFGDLGGQFPCGSRDVHAIAYHPARPAVVYAGGTSSLCRSADGGRTWAKTDLGIDEPHHVRALAVHPGSPGTVFAGSSYKGLFRSGDDGKTWRKVGEGLPSGGRVKAIALPPGDGQRVYVAALAQATGDVGSVYHSQDGGETFEDVGGDLPWEGINAVVVDPRDPELIYVGTDFSGVFRSRDGGRSWEERSRGFVGNRRSATAVAVTADGAVFVATYGALHRSGDQGRTWTRLQSGLEKGRAVERILSHGDLVVAGSEDGPEVWSVDRGVSWESIGGLVGGLACAAPDPHDVGAVYLCDKQGGLVHLTAAGVRRLGEEDWTPSLVSVAADPANPKVILAAQSGGGLWRTQDGGKKWKEFNKGVTTKKGGLMSFAEHRRIHTLVWDKASRVLLAATAQEGVLRSTDGGLSWSVSGLAGEKVNGFAVDPATPQRLAATVRGKGVMRSSDGGATWTLVSEGLPEKRELTGIAFGDAILYATAEDGGIYGIE